MNQFTTEHSTSSPGERLLGGATQDQLNALHNAALVGPDMYGKSVTEETQVGVHGIEAHEKAQDKALALLDDKIQADLVNPALDIGTNLQIHFSDASAIPHTYEEVLPVVDSEIKTCREQEHIDEDQAALITAEIQRFYSLYRKAYPDASPAKAYRLISDNVRKLVYQTMVDRSELVGSEHALKHILEGNMALAEEMIASLEASGRSISDRDKVLIHQTIIDHDLGYTVGAIQARSSKAAGDDHPLFGAQFIQKNKDYYVDKFGEEGYHAIRTSVLYHEFPRYDFNLPVDKEKNQVHSHFIRSVSSTVDAMNTTAEKKTPILFMNAAAMRTLLRMQLAIQTLGDPAKGLESVPVEVRDRLKSELDAIAASETRQEYRDSFTHAVEDFMNGFVLDRTVGQYTGMVTGVKLTGIKDERVVPQVFMAMSRMFPIVGDMFGEHLETAAFMKTMESLGITRREMTEFYHFVHRMNQGKERAESPLVYNSAKAIFVINPVFAEYRQRDYVEIEKLFNEVHALSIRQDINGLLERFSANSLHPHVLQHEAEAFMKAVEEKVTSEEAQRLEKLVADIVSAPVEARGPFVDALKHFMTEKERAFIEGP